MIVNLTKAQRSAVEIYVTDPAHECTALVLEKAGLRVLVDTDEACEILTDAANSADEDGPSAGGAALANLCRTIRIAATKARREDWQSDPTGGA